MSALTNLQDALGTLSTSVDNAVAKIVALPGQNDAAIQSAADAVTAAAQKLDAAQPSAPPPPTP